MCRVRTTQSPTVTRPAAPVRNLTTGGAGRSVDSQGMETEGFYQATLESLPEAVIATDAQGHVRYLNVSAKRLLGMSLNEARGRPFAEVVILHDGATGEAVSSPLTRLLSRSEHPGNNALDRVKQPGGNEIAVDDSAALIRGNSGEVLGMVFTLRAAAHHGF